MAEHSGSSFADGPLVAHRPKPGEFFPGEPRANTRHGVMAGHIIATDQPEQPAGGQAEESTAWFTRDESLGGAGDPIQHLCEIICIEVMKKQIGADHRRPFRPGEPIEHVGPDDVDGEASFRKPPPRFITDRGQPIHQRHSRWPRLRWQCSNPTQRESPVPSAQFDEVKLRSSHARLRQKSGHDPRMAHQIIQSHQIPAGMNRPIIVHRQIVEPLGFNHALHGVDFVS